MSKMTTWQPYKDKDGQMIYDPMAASLAGGNDPNPGGRWSLDVKSGAWTQPNPQATALRSATTPATTATNRSGGGGFGIGASSVNIGNGGSNDFAKLLANRPVHSGTNLRVYQPQSMNYQDALGQVGGSYQMRDEGKLKDTAQLLAALEIDPLKEAVERQEQKQDLRYHNMMKQVDQSFAGKDQVARDLANRLSKQQAQELASRGASMRSGLAEYHTAKVNEAVAQQLTHLEVNKQAAVENLMSEHGLAMEQIDGALMSLEQQRGKLSSANFEKLSSREQEIYLQQENARSQIAMHIMDQFMRGEQTKLQASLAELESADKRYATDIQAWLGGLDASLRSSGMALDAKLKNRALELDYLQAMLPYTNLTVKDEALLDIDWTRLMGETPRR
jgi:hypothetical protein